MRKLVIILSLLIFSSRASAQTNNLENVRRIIEQKNKIFRKAYLTGDSALFASIHHSETQSMPPDGSLLVGKGAIGKTVKGGPYQGIKDMIINISAVFGGPEYVIEQGSFILKTDKDQHNGKYLVIWKQESGAWKIYRAIWNLN